jgi:hypothetical protein
MEKKFITTRRPRQIAECLPVWVKLVAELEAREVENRAPQKLEGQTGGPAERQGETGGHHGRLTLHALDEVADGAQQENRDEQKDHGGGHAALSCLRGLGGKSAVDSAMPREAANSSILGCRQTGI